MLIAFAVLCFVLGAGLYVYQHREQYKEKVIAYIDERNNNRGIKGLIIGPIQMVIIRYIGTPIVATVITFVLSLVMVAVAPLQFMSWSHVGIFMGSGVLMTIWFVRPDEKLSVPINTVAALTFFGTLYRIYLAEGDYDWWLRKFFFDRSTLTRRDFTTRKKDGVKDANGVVTEPQEDGFVKVTKIPFTLYNEKPNSANGLVPISLIDGFSKTGSPVKSELLITLEPFDSHLMLRNDDPGLEIAERARSMFRTCMGFFTSVDNAVAKDSIAHLIEGKTMVVAFTRESIDALPEGSIVRDTGGEPTYAIVEITDGDWATAREKNPSASEADAHAVALKRTIKEYTKHLKTHLTDSMRDVVTLKTAKKGADGQDHVSYKYVIETRSVEVGLNTILANNGFRLTSASVGNVAIDDSLKSSAVDAERQNFENSVQVQSARATANALKELRSTPEEQTDPGYLDKLGIAAASDPSGRAGYNRISTDNRLATVGAAAAAINKGKDTA